MRRSLWVAALVIATAANAALFCSSLALRRRAANPIAASAEDPRAAAVEELIHRYFRTWSNQDIQGYGECFRSNSSIQFIDEQGKIAQFALPEFLADQNEVFRGGQHEIEVPESINIRFESDLARVVVAWKLTVGSKEVLGYDHFTLLKRDDKWGIVNLVWYVTKHSA
jgi:hypothetical protein